MARIQLILSVVAAATFTLSSLHLSDIAFRPPPAPDYKVSGRSQKYRPPRYPGLHLYKHLYVEQDTPTT